MSNHEYLEVEPARDAGASGRDMIQLRFLGGAGTVTGSKYLLDIPGGRILIDCGLFQGLKPLRLMNWNRFPVAPSSIDAVILTHAHLDHSGYLPLLVRHGFRGPIYCTPATKDLCGILLPDSGHLQERDAEFANRHGFSKHHPALPLYTEADATKSLGYFKPQELGKGFSVGAGCEVRLLPAGHILGAAIVEIRCAGTTLVFSGDLGRPNSPTTVDPAAVKFADFLIMESTYGDRLHDRTDPEDILTKIITRTAERGGVILIPIFAVGRVQMVLYHLLQLKRARRIPDLPVFLDSPMAIDASRIFRDHPGEHKLDPEQCRALCAAARYVNSVEESKALMRNHMPKIILAASGMATGGRVLHHLKTFAPNPANTILFTGFQAAGTRGASLVGGAASIKMHGEYVPVRAEVRNLNMLSAHADRGEIIAWLRRFKQPPRLTFITHGEPEAASGLEAAIKAELGWTCRIPRLGETIGLGIRFP